VAKGFVPALVATLAAGHVAGALAGGAAMLGHWRPIFLRFARGGKMVATCGGALFGLAPLVGLAGASLARLRAGTETRVKLRRKPATTS
jgi:acyl phosphate:glycerol-3-phosphate acyltransferase